MMQGNESELRIGLIADTHEAERPLDLIENLSREVCAFYVHLGDVGGSATTTRLVHEFKDAMGNLDHLSRQERAQYQALRNQGMSAIWAYIEMRSGGNPYADRERQAETAASYALVLGAMAQLKPVYFLTGNIDRAAAASDAVSAILASNGVSLVVEPELIDLQDQAVILWPSMKPFSAWFIAYLDDVVNKLVRAVSTKSRVIVLAHEQLFKGPVPDTYRANAARAGYRPLTVPYFEPNPTWRQLLRLFRLLPSSVDTVFVHGHVHDPCQVIQAGAPYLRGSAEHGIEYRLAGLSNGQKNGWMPGERRTLRIFCVPAQEAMSLRVTAHEVSMHPAKGKAGARERGAAGGDNEAPPLER